MTADVRPVVAGRRLDVLLLLAEGLTDEQIGERLRLSASTVKHHLGCLYEALGAVNRTHAVALGFRAGLLR